MITEFFVFLNPFTTFLVTITTNYIYSEVDTGIGENGGKP